MSTPSSMFQFADQNNTPANNEEEHGEKREVNLDEELEVKDPSADFNITPPPPPAGRYPAKLALTDAGIDGRNSAKVGNFLSVPISVSIITNDEAFNGYKVIDYLNSIYDTRKGTTALHSLMDKLGEPMAAKMSLREIKAHVERVLNSNPVISVELEWQAKEKDAGNKRADKGGYVTLATRMKDFDRNLDGTRSNFKESERDGGPVPATAHILGYYK